MIRNNYQFLKALCSGESQSLGRGLQNEEEIGSAFDDDQKCLRKSECSPLAVRGASSMNISLKQIAGQLQAGTCIDNVLDDGQIALLGQLSYDQVRRKVDNKEDAERVYYSLAQRFAGVQLDGHLPKLQDMIAYAFKEREGRVPEECSATWSSQYLAECWNGQDLADKRFVELEKVNLSLFLEDVINMGSDAERASELAYYLSHMAANDGHDLYDYIYLKSTKGAYYIFGTPCVLRFSQGQVSEHYEICSETGNKIDSEAEEE